MEKTNAKTRDIIMNKIPYLRRYYSLTSIGDFTFGEDILAKTNDTTRGIGEH